MTTLLLLEIFPCPPPCKSLTHPPCLGAHPFLHHSILALALHDIPAPHQAVVAIFTTNTTKDIAGVSEIGKIYCVELTVFMVGVLLKCKELAAFTDGLAHCLAVGFCVN